MTLATLAVDDPLYGSIDLTSHEYKIIRTRAFHRLHYLKQLGFTFLAIPSASSSRFEHSIGVMRNATIMAEQLRRRQELSLSNGDLNTLRAAALLHDVGHGPFSHFFEKILRLFKTDVSQAAVSAEIIRTDPPLHSTLRDGGLDPDRIANIIDPRKLESLTGNDLLFAKIVSGDIDADRIDYLLRDCFFTGLPQSIDADRTIRALTYRNVPVYPAGRADLFLREEDVELADALLMARLSLRQYVWTNPINRAAESLVFRAVEYATQDGARSATLRGLEGMSLAEKFRFWTDDDLLWELTAAKGQAAKIISRLIEGNLFQEKIRVRFPELNPEIINRLERAEKMKKTERVNELYKMEREYAELLAREAKFDRDAILVDFPELGSIQEITQKVLLDNGGYTLLSDRSSFAARISELFRQYYTAHVFVVDWAGFRGGDHAKALEVIRRVMSAPGLRS